jgi:hypothetical protein
MKYILTVIFLAALTASAQQSLHSGKYHITRPNATTNIIPSKTTGENFSIDRIDVHSGTVEGQGNLLMTGINDYFFWFNATPTAASITQIGTSGAYTIPIPTTVTATKAFFIPDKFTVIAYSGTKWGIATAGYDELKPQIFPIEVRLLINGSPTGTLACVIRESGAVVWPSNIVYTASAINSTGLVQYFIN